MSLAPDQIAVAVLVLVSVAALVYLNHKSKPSA